MKIHPVLKNIGKYAYIWPDGTKIECDSLYFLIKLPNEEVEVIVGVTELKVWGSIRKKIFIFVKNTPIVEFVATDNYDKTGNLIAVLKKPSSGEMYKLNEKLPYELEKFNIVYHKDYIKNGYDRLGILVNSSDLKTIIEYAIIRAKWMGIIRS